MFSYKIIFYPRLAFPFLIHIQVGLWFIILAIYPRFTRYSFAIYLLSTCDVFAIFGYSFVIYSLLNYLFAIAPSLFAVSWY
jgi:hypothetical protein